MAEMRCAWDIRCSFFFSFRGAARSIFELWTEPDKMFCPVSSLYVNNLLAPVPYLTARVVLIYSPNSQQRVNKQIFNYRTFLLKRSTLYFHSLLPFATHTLPFTLLHYYIKTTHSGSWQNMFVQSLLKTTAGGLQCPQWSSEYAHRHTAHPFPSGYWF